MKVCYVTMVFPVTSETFACLDVRTLREAGVAVSVHALRPARPLGLDEPPGLFRAGARTRAAQRMMQERGLGDVPLSQGTWAANARGAWFAVTHPTVALDVIAWLLRYNWSAPRHLLKSLALVWRALDIFAAVRRTQPDVVHLFWGHYPAIVGYLVRRHLPDVTLSVFLGAYDLNRHYPGTAPVARSADVVWTHCQDNLPAIAALGVPASRIRVAYRGIDVATARPVPAPRIRHRVLTAGRLRPEKAMQDVVRAFAHIHARRPDASLVILGDGPERPRLEADARTLGVASAVTFRGYVSPDAVREEMSRAEVFMLLSRSDSERLPNVVKEAMVSGCVCVTSRTQGIEELVEDGVTGFVTPQGDAAAAARQVNEVFDHPERSRAIVTAAGRQVHERFDVRRTMRTYEEHWTFLRHRRRGEVPADAQESLTVGSQTC